MTDGHNLEAAEQLIPIAQSAGLSLAHMALGFVIARPTVTSAILGPRTMQHLDDLLAGAEVRLGDDVLDQIDQIVPPRIDVGLHEANYNPPTLLNAGLRRRPISGRTCCVRSTEKRTPGTCARRPATAHQCVPPTPAGISIASAPNSVRNWPRLCDTAWAPSRRSSKSPTRRLSRVDRTRLRGPAPSLLTRCHHFMGARASPQRVERAIQFSLVENMHSCSSTRAFRAK
jgi:Aldo/keto reductase family